jgi:hypothetical protein
MTGLLLALVLVLAAVGALIFAHRQPTAGSGSQRIAAEAAVRSQAVAWVTSQVGHDIVLACDAVMCSDLAQHGFPPGDLSVLAPTAPDPYGSELVIATAGIRSQFGDRLATVYAPTVLASFGTGPDRIDIRVVAKNGAAYRIALRNDLLARQHSGAELLASSRITVTTLARQQLKVGQVDLRLLTAIAFLSAQQPVSIVGFGSLAPGADPQVPLRYADLAENDPAGHLTSAGYVQALLAVIHGLRAPYVPNSVASMRLPGGQLVLRIEFPAPSPLGLLQS